MEGNEALHHPGQTTGGVPGRGWVVGCPGKGESARWEHPICGKAAKKWAISPRSLWPLETQGGCPPVLPWRPGAFGPWAAQKALDSATCKGPCCLLHLVTALLAFHWGGEEGGPICQICKKGGKVVFSQENRGRKGARASCPDQNGFTD